MIDREEIARSFQLLYGRTPRVYRAPGRVNLIGEHTDYNDGFVMPMAIDRSTWVAAAPRADGQIVARSREYGETRAIGLRQPLHPDSTAERGHWSDYVRGVASVLDRSGGGDGGNEARTWPGADLLIASDVPIGAGLSSSAALEIACGYALADLSKGALKAAIDLTDLARAGQRAEHEFVGTRCGIMDQMIACHARAGNAMWLDTRTLERRYLPLAADVRVVICNTMVSHRLADAEYNARRADCEAGVSALGRRHPGIAALRDVTLEQLEAAKDDLPEAVFRRCRHVIAENLRVAGAARALSDSDFATFGQLMNQSHESLRADYQVSCAELDTMASIARRLDGVHGARMTGGGFGGCVVALVDVGAVAHVEQRVIECYQAATGLRPDVWISSAGSGVGAV